MPALLFLSLRCRFATNNRSLPRPCRGLQYSLHKTGQPTLSHNLSKTSNRHGIVNRGNRRRVVEHRRASSHSHACLYNVAPRTLSFILICATLRKVSTETETLVVEKRIEKRERRWSAEEKGRLAKEGDQRYPMPEPRSRMEQVWGPTARRALRSR